MTERDQLAMLPVLEKVAQTLAPASRVLFTEPESLEKQKAALDPRKGGGLLIDKKSRPGLRCSARLPP